MNRNWQTPIDYCTLRKYIWSRHRNKIQCRVHYVRLGESESWSTALVGFSLDQLHSLALVKAWSTALVGFSIDPHVCVCLVRGIPNFIWKKIICLLCSYMRLSQSSLQKPRLNDFGRKKAVLRKTGHTTKRSCTCLPQVRSGSFGWHNEPWWETASQFHGCWATEAATEAAGATGRLTHSWATTWSSVRR